MHSCFDVNFNISTGLPSKYRKEVGNIDSTKMKSGGKNCTQEDKGFEEWFFEYKVELVRPVVFTLWVWDPLVGCDPVFSRSQN